MKFDEEKYKVLCLERSNPVSQDSLGAYCLESSFAEEDAGCSVGQKEEEKSEMCTCGKGHQHPGLH